MNQWTSVSSDMEKSSEIRKGMDKYDVNLFYAAN